MHSHNFGRVSESIIDDTDHSQFLKFLIDSAVQYPTILPYGALKTNNLKHKWCDEPRSQGLEVEEQLCVLNLDFWIPLPLRMPCQWQSVELSAEILCLLAAFLSRVPARVKLPDSESRSNVPFPLSDR